MSIEDNRENKQKEFRLTRQNIEWIVCAFAAGLLIGFLAERAMAAHADASAIAEDSAGDETICAHEDGAYQFTNPLLLCTPPEDIPSSQYSGLVNQINTFIQNSTTQSANQNGDQDTASVYYQDLNSEQWFGINEDAQYSPASLLKVPVMIAYYKQSQTDPSLLDSTLTYSGATDANAGETFKSKYDIVPGTYTVNDLMKAMIVNSDNNALDLLSQGLDQNVINQLYAYLGVPLNSSGSVDFMTAKVYAQFFRILYNATYLSKMDSENALALLVSADFPEGLRATIPSSVSIAQKFGERTDQYPDGVVQECDLHDCGIIYTPSDPYLLCVMTKMVIGNTEPSGAAAAQADFQNLADMIQGVSKIIYLNQTSQATL